MTRLTQFIAISAAKLTGRSSLARFGVTVDENTDYDLVRTALKSKR